ERAEDEEDVLRRQVQEAHHAQGHAVQEGQGQRLRARKAAVRPQAVGLWRADEARLPQEGEDDEEDRVEAAVPVVQAHAPNAHQGERALASAVGAGGRAGVGGGGGVAWRVEWSRRIMVVQGYWSQR
ncbi:unnamed protein product, partial [Closterium sp. Naga37s-1]